MKAKSYGILPGMLMLLISMPLHAQAISVMISEATVNQLLTAIGPIKGKGTGSQQIPYSWTVTDPKVAFTPGKGTFEANIRVVASGVIVRDKVHGKLDFFYDQETNKIRIEVVDATFPLKINMMGRTVNIGTIDLSDIYQTKFEFNGPDPVQEDISIDVGGKKPRVVSVTASGHSIRPVQDALAVSVDLIYEGRDGI